MPPDRGDDRGRSTPAQAYFPEPTDEAIAHAARLLAASERPLVLAGNGVLRRRASAELRAFAKGLHVPVAATFMGKGAIDDRSHLSLMAVGLQARDHVLTGFDRADLVVCGRLRPGRVRAVALEPRRPQADHPHRHPAGRGRRGLPARGRADRRHRRARCERLLAAVLPLRRRRPRRQPSATRRARPSSTRTCGRRSSPTSSAYEHDDGWPIKPQKAIADLRRALGPEDIVVSDVGAHKIWVARLYQAYEPNTVIISNGFAAMGISLPGAIAAKLVHPDRQVVALCGDGGFLMNSQELETAQADRREHHRRRLARRRLRAHRLEAAQRVRPAVRRRVRRTRTSSPTPSLRDRRVPADVGGRPLPDPDARARASTARRSSRCPIDYRENLRLTERLGGLCLAGSDGRPPGLDYAPTTLTWTLAALPMPASGQ